MEFTWSKFILLNLAPVQLEKNCIHMLSDKVGLRMKLGENDLQPQNTAVVKRRVREPKRQKPGRKRPQPGDISLENLEQGNPEQGMEQQEDMEQRMEQQDMEQSMEQENLEQCMEQQDMEQSMGQQDMANITTEEEKIQQLSDFLKEMSTDKTMLTQFVQQKGFHLKT